MLSLIGCTLAALLAGSDQVDWEADYHQAFENAKARDVPLLICFNMDGEGASDQTAERLYHDPEFVKKSRDFVCLIASIGNHESQSVTTNGESRQVCARFGAVTCEEHLKVEIRASDEFVGRDSVVSPQHILVSPNRETLARKAYQISLPDLLKLMRLAEKSLRQGLDTSAAQRLDELMELAQDSNAEVRAPAIAELGRMEALDASRFLVGLLNNKTMSATRIDVIDALAVKGNYDALEGLLSQLNDSNNMVVKHAIVALEKLALPDAGPALLKMWKKRPKSIIEKELPRALAACVPDDPAVRKLIYKAAKSQDSSVELSAIVALAQLADDPRTFKVLKDKLGDRNGNVRGVTAWVLGMSRQPDAISLLEKAADGETNVDVRQCIAAAIRNLNIESGPEDAELSNSLGQFLSDDVSR